MGPRIAYGDESMRQSHDPKLYLLGACTVDNPREVSSRLIGSLPKGAQKLHWHDMPLADQQRSLQAIAECKGVWAYIAALPYEGRQERARRKRLEILLPFLESRGVEELVLESREERDNKRDVALLLAARSKHLVGRIDLHHEPGPQNPLLWLPDQLIGAYGDSICNIEKTLSWNLAWRKVKGCIQLVT